MVLAGFSLIFLTANFMTSKYILRTIIVLWKSWYCNKWVHIQDSYWLICEEFWPQKCFYSPETQEAVICTSVRWEEPHGGGNQTPFWCLGSSRSLAAASDVLGQALGAWTLTTSEIWTLRFSSPATRVYHFWQDITLNCSHVMQALRIASFRSCLRLKRIKHSSTFNSFEQKFRGSSGKPITV